MIQLLKIALPLLFSIALLVWRFWLGTKEQAIYFQGHCGYWWMWGVLLASVWAFWQLWVKSDVTWQKLLSDLKRRRWHLLLTLACSAFLHMHEPHDYKVFYDEPSHLMVSKMMHTERLAMIAGRSHYVGDSLLALNPIPTFRQYFYPFLLSLSHDLFGYSTQAPFVLNGIFTVLFLGAVWVFAARLGGDFAGMVAVLLMTSLPLLAQNATSAGYDVLNVFLVVCVAIVGWYFWESTKEKCSLWWNCLLALTLMASQVRYESILYFGFVGLLLVARWVRDRSVFLTWFAVIIPFALIPSFASNLHYMRTELLLMANLRAAGQPFMGFGYLPEHFQHLLYYLYTYDFWGTSSTVLSYMGTLGFATIIASLIKRGDLVSRSKQVYLFCFSVFVLLMYILTLTNFWGSPLDGLATRFALPLLFCLAIAGSWLIKNLCKTPVWRSILTLALVIALISTTAKTNARHQSTDLHFPSRSEKWFLEYAKAYDPHSTLLVSKAQIMLANFGYPAVSIEYMSGRAEACVKILQAGIYKDILILERSEYPKVRQNDPLRNPVLVPPNICVEEVARRYFSLGDMGRILRFVGYRKADGTLVTPQNAPPLPTEFESDAARENFMLSLYP